MMSKGFITTATLQKPENDSEYTDLYITDLEIGKANDEDFAIEIFTVENGATLNLTLPEAKAVVEALEKIISRYDEK